MVAILMMSAKLATLGFLGIERFGDFHNFCPWLFCHVTQLYCRYDQGLVTSAF